MYLQLKINTDLIYFYSASSILFGEHKRSGCAKLESIFKAAILRQQGPVHIGRLLYTDIIKLHDNGGK